MTISEIKKLCQDLGIRPSKGKGQNFLTDENVLQEIVAAADLNKKDYVLEIGPGFGVLTEALLAKCKKVLSVELDKRLVFFLKHKFKGHSNLDILEADILKTKNQQLAKRLGSENYSLVANLPYAISKPVLHKFLNYQPKPKEMIVLLQKEVAEKIIAKPGQMSLLGLSVQYCGQPQILAKVPSQSFYPMPKVDSAIVKIIVNHEQFPAKISQILSAREQQNFQEKKLWQLIKIGFSSPRKQLQNNLANGLEIDKNKVKNILKKQGLHEQIRAEDLDIGDWAKLYQQLMV